MPGHYDFKRETLLAKLGWLPRQANLLLHGGLHLKQRLPNTNLDHQHSEAFSHSWRTASLSPCKKASGVAGPNWVRHIHCFTIFGISGWTVASGPRPSFRGKLAGTKCFSEDHERSTTCVPANFDKDAAEGETSFVHSLFWWTTFSCFKPNRWHSDHQAVFPSENTTDLCRWRDNTFCKSPDCLTSANDSVGGREPGTVTCSDCSTSKHLPELIASASLSFFKTWIFKLLFYWLFQHAKWRSEKFSGSKERVQDTWGSVISARPTPPRSLAPNTCTWTQYDFGRLLPAFFSLSFKDSMRAWNCRQFGDT